MLPRPHRSAIFDGLRLRFSRWEVQPFGGCYPRAKGMKPHPPSVTEEFSHYFSPNPRLELREGRSARGTAPLAGPPP